MKYSIAIAPALILAAALTASPALAAPHEGNAFIHDYDTDHDGKVTRAEFDAARTVRFKATDANGDGWVSEDEYVSEYSKRLEEQLKSFDRGEEKKVEERQRQIRQTHVRFGVLDKDKDNKMTKAEYDASGDRAFAEQDDDKDGAVTLADTKATAAKRQIEMAKRADRPE
jgi:Ca2+-binding EF-hand superfamily protein